MMMHKIVMWQRKGLQQTQDLAVREPYADGDEAAIVASSCVWLMKKQWCVQEQLANMSVFIFFTIGDGISGLTV